MIAVPACAKVNLAFEVLGRRPDGYHEVSSVLAALDWHDLVSVELRPAAVTRVEVEVDGPWAEPSMAAPEALAARAAAALAELAGAPLDIRVRVHKRLFVAAGLGGGSADAAAVLRAGAAALDLLDPPLRIPLTRLLSAGARLGADVPAVLLGGTCVAAGRGECLTPIAAPSLHLAVAFAGPAITAQAYAALADDERRGGGGRTARVVAALAAGRAPAPGDCGSDLEPAALRVNPVLEGRLARLRSRTGLPWPLTGSGGAAFQLAESAARAAGLAAAATAAGLPARACRTLAQPHAGSGAAWAPTADPYNPTA